MFEYNATIIRIVDGDTVVCSVDLGFSIFIIARVRLNHINAPESKGETAKEGKAASEWLRKAIEGKDVTLRTQRAGKKLLDKYGRVLGEICLPGDTMTVNERMVIAGHAVPYEGGKR